MKFSKKNFTNESFFAVVLVFVFIISFDNLDNVDALNRTDYNINEIKDGVYMVSANGYNSMFLTTGQGVVVIDSPPGIGNKIFDAISESTNETIKYLIYSHAHKDHIGSAHLFPLGINIIAQENTKDLLTTANDPDRPIPTMIFVNETTLDIGNKTIKLFYPGQYHQRGNIFIYLPEQKVLMVVDQIIPGNVPWKHLASTPEVPALIKSYDLAMGYDFDVYVPGHGRLGSLKDIQLQKEYLEDLKSNAKMAINVVNFTDVTKNVNKENNAAVTETYFNALTQKCIEQIDAKWKDKLVGVGTWTDEHCEKMIQSLRVD